MKNVRILAPVLSVLPSGVPEMADLIPSPLLALDGELKILSANRSFCETFRLPPEAVLGKPVYRLKDAPWEPVALKTWLEEALSRSRQAENYALPGADPALRVSACRFPAPPGDAEIYWLVFSVLPGRLEQLQQANRELERKLQKEKSGHYSLAQVARQFQIIFRHAMDGIVLGELESRRFLLCNPAFEKLLGYSKTEVKNLRVQDLHPETELPSVLESFRKLMEGKITCAHNIAVKRQDGSLFYADITGTAFSVRGKKYLIGSFRDVSALKAVQEKLQESEENFRTLAQSSQEGILIASGPGNFIYANPRAAEFTGYTPQELCGKSLADLAHPAELKKLLRKYRNRISGKGRPSTYETRIVCRDGKARPVEIIGNRTVWQGEPADLILARDISFRKQARHALKQSEARLRHTLDNMLEGCQIIGRDWRYRYVNRTATVQGRMTREQLLGHTMMEVYPGIENTPLFETLRRCMKKRKSEILENRFTYPDSSTGWFELCIQPVPEGIFILSIDITSRKTAEEAVLQLTRDLLSRNLALQNLNQDLEAFSASVSHDLRSPLARIDSLAQLLLLNHNRMEKNADDYLKQIHAICLQATGLMEGLLKLSRISRSEMRPEPVDLSRLVNEIAHELQEREPERRVTFIVQPGLIAQGDMGLLKIALGNLLNNAWKFTSQHPSARIEFGSRREGGQILYFLRDDGAGFKPEPAEKLFTPFGRLKHQYDFPGSGLGLTIVQRIIQRHGGAVRLEGEEEKGATVYFTLG